MQNQVLKMSYLCSKVLDGLTDHVHVSCCCVLFTEHRDKNALLQLTDDVKKNCYAPNFSQKINTTVQFPFNCYSAGTVSSHRHTMTRVFSYVTN